LDPSSLSLLVIHGSEYRKKRELGMDPIHRVHLCEFGAIWYQISHNFAQEKQQIILLKTNWLCHHRSIHPSIGWEPSSRSSCSRT
jgi:hypothetical protein